MTIPLDAIASEKAAQVALDTRHDTVNAHTSAIIAAYLDALVESGRAFTDEKLFAHQPVLIIRLDSDT
jgi:hypothetical protein